jgi:hypothetical protein
MVKRQRTKHLTGDEEGDEGRRAELPDQENGERDEARRAQ